MAQRFAYKNANSRTRNQYPYLLDIRSDLLSELRTTIVIPHSPAKIAAPMKLSRLNPSFSLDGEIYIGMTQDMAGIDRGSLGGQGVDLSEYWTEVIAAVDFLVLGI